jgi:non-ribosomal peptide synthetase-like protein
MVLGPLGAMYRSAPLLAFALRALGASVGRNLQCAHNANLSGPVDLISIGDDVAIQSAAYVNVTRWVGQELHIGPVRLESGCKIGMRAGVANDVTVGRGTWITPFTPILGDTGANEMWEGAPARLAGRYTHLQRAASACGPAPPTRLLETANILMQVLAFLCLNLVPTAVILWLMRGLIPAGEARLANVYFQVTPLPEIALHLALYAIVSGWAIIVVTSALKCLFVRWTAFSPGIYASQGLKGALLLYRLTLMNALQTRWNWTITGQYLRALAGMRFTRVGASECDLMYNLVPELVNADAQVFWSAGSYTNMLDYGADHIALRQVDMPRNFFSGNNCVVEHGQLPTNFLVGVSTPASDIAFRRQMRSRPGEPITVAGSPPVKFASAPFEAENEAHRPPGFAIFLTRLALNDLFSIALLRVAEGLVFTIVFLCLLRLGLSVVPGAIAAFVATELGLIGLCVATKRALVGNEWGADHATPFWSWRHFAYFFAQDCFFVWCRGPLAFCAGTVLANPILRWMGCRIGKRTIVSQPLQCFDWNAVSFGNDCMIDGFLQLHTFENMQLKAKRSHFHDGCTVTFGATVMGGAVVGRDTTLMPLSLVLKEMHLITATYEGSPAEPVPGSLPFVPVVPPPRGAARLEMVREAAE